MKHLTFPNALTLLALQAGVSELAIKRQLAEKIVFEGNNCTALEGIVACQEQTKRNIKLDRERKEAARLRKEKA